MTTGTTLVAFKHALVDALRARGGLAGVQVEYAFPEDALQDEAIWVEGVDASMTLPVLRAGTKPVDEDYTVTLAVQVLKSQGESQETADTRLLELFAEVQQCFAEQPQLIPEIQWALPTGWKHILGVLPTGMGHGSRFDVRVRVKARLFP
ncbi:hypothetical protein [Actinopolyspora halophila]|uniref:hypothetical protein n=1 Tax=Actinopolyspora halophila TaxID=1850 RepID=UPI00037043AB|nr:hypothetical protein [Actinopolyspora halophila]